MHRTLSVPRLIGWSSLALALLFQLSVNSAQAQAPFPGPNRPVIELAVGTARTCQMTTHADLKRVENPNSNIVRVERVPDKSNEIMLVAEGPGRATITFTDQRDRVEVHEIIVAAAQVQPAGPMMEPNYLTLPKGAFKSIRLREIPTGGVQVENSKVVKVIKGEQLDVVTFEGVDFGQTRVTFFSGPNKDRMEIYVVTVAPEDRADKGVQQVEVHVVVAEVSRSEARNMSFSWLTANNNWFIASLIGGPGTLASGLVMPPSAVSLSSSGANVPFGVLNSNGGTIGFLNALRTEGLTKVLAEPRVTTLSGRPGRIVAGGETPVVLAGTAGSVPSVEYKPFGTIVNFLPVVKANGKIYLEVRPEVSDIDPAVGINVGGINAPGFKTRSAQVSVEIEDGQTLAIGGLIQTKVGAQISRVPFLGDIPFLGAAFSSKTYSETETELLILVTPRLVAPVDCTKIPRYLPGRETRSPDDFEFFLEGIMEAPRGQRNVVLHPHLYKPAYHNAPNAGEIPCGNGNGNGCYTRGGNGCASGNCYGSHSSLPAPGGSLAMPRPSFPDIQSSPSDLPTSFPPTSPNAAPMSPGLPALPARQQEPRPVLPPLSYSPGGR
jgi:Flp pilus assembly secretin CpaC